MFKKLTGKLKRQAHPFVVLAAGLTLIGLITSLSGILNYQYELDHLSSPTISTVAKAQPAGLAKNTSGKLGQAATQELAGSSGQSGGSAGTKPNPSNARQPVAANTASNSAAAAAGQQTPAGAPNVSAVTVSLSVNGVQRGNISLSGASNQCDVLTRALDTGLISDLDMRYNSQYGTYAVYVIDGIGDSDSVWWTYTVNGKSPPVGCGKLPVHAGDSINWQYVKQ